MPPTTPDRTITLADALEAVTVAIGSLPQQAARLRDVEGTIAAMGRAWHALLGDLTPAELSAAVLRHLALSPFLPSPADLRRIASEARHGRPPAGAEAWEPVRKAIGAVGRNRAPSFADPVTARVVAALGWRELCDSENAIADRARFIEAYDALAGQQAEDRAVAGLPGVARPALPAEATPRAAGELVGEVARRLRLVSGGRP